MNATTLREFKKQYPEHKEILLSDFNRIIKQFNTNILEDVIVSRNGISLPERVGHILIMSFPVSKKKIVDFGTSNKTGVLTYHRNWETDGRLGKIVYSSGNYSIQYSRLWGFTATSIFRKKMSKIYMKLWEKYIYVDANGININSILK